MSIPPRQRAPWLCGSVCLTFCLLALGCGGKGDQAEDAGTTTATGEENVAVDFVGEVEYDSLEGRFHVIWPDGCPRIRVQSQDDPDADDPAKLAQAYIYCDRKDREAEGCGVSVHFKMRDEDGGPPTPDMVIQKVKDVMQSFGVEILQQRPVRRGEMEGVQVHCREPNGTGEVWVEGLLFGLRVYILNAWKADGGLFQAPEYIKFFESFRPAD